MHVRYQHTLLGTHPRPVRLAAADLADHATYPTHRMAQPAGEMLGRPATTGWAQEFFELNSIASFRISMSIRWSAMILRSR